jgi:L-ribulose-5-phosphate 3-epimerase
MDVDAAIDPADRRPGVCSWSLRPQSPADLVDAVRTCGLSAVQLALDPVRTNAWPLAVTRAALADAGIEILSGMMEMAGEDYSSLESIRVTGGVRPAETWAVNLAAAAGNAQVAEQLGLDLVTFHAGFLPHETSDPERRVMIERLRTIAEVFAEHGVAVALETGQESAETLVAVLEAIGRDDVGVNFDPANMILYAMGDPVAAIERLGPFVRQIHVKDALPTTEPGTWGTEVPVGEGAVDWTAFLAAASVHAPRARLVIEREAGEQRATDVRTAVRFLESLAGAAR